MNVIAELSEGLTRPCPVCSAQMGKEVKALSYGALCCLSCRAFFRRCHQDTRQPDLQCRTNGNCTLDATTRRRCARCRLDACLRNGMQPDYVLSHDEKRRRFQRARARTDPTGFTSSHPKLLIPLNYEDSDPSTPESSFSSPKSYYDSRLSQFEDPTSPAPWRSYDSHYMTPASNNGYNSYKNQAPNPNFKAAANSSMSFNGGRDSSFGPTPWPGNYGYNEDFGIQEKQNNFNSEDLLKQLGITPSNKTPMTTIEQVNGTKLEEPFSSPWGSSSNSEDDLAQITPASFANPAKAIAALEKSLKPASEQKSFLDEFLASHEVQSCDQDDANDHHSEAKRVLIQALQENVGEFMETAVKAKIKLKDKEDWSALFKQNKRLVVNFVFSRFLTGANRKQQRLWLCSKNSCGCNMDSVGFSDVNAFINEAVDLFGSDKVMQNVYMGFAKSLGNLKVEPVHKSQLFSMLFFYQGSLPLNNSLAACREFLGTIQNLNQTTGCNMPLQEVYEAGRTLEAMSVLFEHSGLAGKYLPEYAEDYGVENASLSFGCTDEETAWLADQKESTLQALASVPMGNDLAKQLLDYSWNNCTLNMSFSYGCARVYKERFWRLYCRYDEFNALSETDQASIVLSSHHLFSALMTAMTDGMPIVDLVKFGFSMVEVEQDRNLRFILETSPEKQAKLRPISLRKMFPSLPGDYEDCVESIQSVIRRGDNGHMNFFAILIMVLFDPVVIGCKTSKAKRERWQGLEALSKRYKLAMARHFGSEWEDFEFKIRSTLLDLRILASMINPNEAEVEEQISAAAYGLK